MSKPSPAAASGLETIRAIMTGSTRPPAMAGLMGFWITEAEEGRVVFSGVPGERHYNPMGVVHGGFAATLLDSCMTCAIQTTLPPGLACTTTSLNIYFTRAMTAHTGAVFAEGKVIHRGRQAPTAEGRLTDAKGRLLAHGATSCLVFAAPGETTAA